MGIPKVDAAIPIDPIDRDRLVQLRFLSWHEAFTYPARLATRLPNEGHGFIRAVKGMLA